MGSIPIEGAKHTPVTEIGRHAGLRNQCHRACGFESHREYQLNGLVKVSISMRRLVLQQADNLLSKNNN